VTQAQAEAAAAAQATGDELLVVDHLEKYFPITRGIVFQKEVAAVKAVDGVSFSLREGETLGVVGESGCGKSTMARCILKLLEPTGGRVVYRGQDITKLSRAEMRPFRRDMQIVFQDPYGSLSPRMSISDIIEEGLWVHHPNMSAEERERRVIQALAATGMQPGQLIAQAFSGIAEKAEKIGQLNVSPELLNALLEKPMVLEAPNARRQ